jgi:hypothetical protein
MKRTKKRTIINPVKGKSEFISSSALLTGIPRELLIAELVPGAAEKLSENDGFENFYSFLGWKKVH